jgi:hypothetical protein
LLPALDAGATLTTGATLTAGTLAAGVGEGRLGALTAGKLLGAEVAALPSAAATFVLPLPEKNRNHEAPPSTTRLAKSPLTKSPAPRFRSGAGSALASV